MPVGPIHPGSVGELTWSDSQAALLQTVADEIDGATAPARRAVHLDWRHELAVRGRLLGRLPSGRSSASDACRILRSADGWIAISVARPWDVEVLPALVEGPVSDDHWMTLGCWVAGRPGADVVRRARLLDMAAAELDLVAPDTPIPLSATRRWPSRDAPDMSELRVVDLSSLWAGPLAARVLSDAGATVTKVESVSRPDGARETPDFYRHLHPADQSTVVVDLSSARGRDQLHRLVEAADVVIEASRPRALEQLGSGPEQVRPKPGRVWLSITGYGRHGPGANWIAFGDDAAVAGGLTARTDVGEPIFCADAVADPVTGLFGAAAVLRSLAAGGGHLIDLALAGAAAAVARAGACASSETLEPIWPS